MTDSTPVKRKVQKRKASDHAGMLMAFAGRMFEFGALAVSLRNQFPGIPAYKTRSYQKFANAIVLLAVHNVLTEKQVDSARKRIMWQICQDCDEAGV